jgi:hypothetical protein
LADVHAQQLIAHRQDYERAEAYIELPHLSRCI